VQQSSARDANRRVRERLTYDRRRSAGPYYRTRTPLAAPGRQAQARGVVGGGHGASSSDKGPSPWTAAPCGHALR